MKPLFHGWRYAAVCALLLGLPVAAAACSDPAAGTSESNVDADLEILFPEMYSTFDGVHDYRVPAKVVGVKNVKWSADPSDAVELEKQADGSVMITVKKASVDVTIIAKAGNLKATAPLHISSATEENWKDGSDRYNNGVTWKKGDGKGGSGGGGGGGDADGGVKKEKGERKVDPLLSCTNCHNKGGKGGDVEHTPMQTAGYTDQELITIFTEAKKPAGVAMRVTTQEKWSKMHKWQMDEDEKKGLVTYIRSLKPESQGEVDFGGRGGGKGGGKGDDKGSSSSSGGSKAPRDDGGSGSNPQ